MKKDERLFSFRKHPAGNLLNGKKERKGKEGWLRQSMGILLAAMLAFNTMPTGSFAASISESRGSGLCEHHTEHTEDCGYAEAQPCTHEHTEEKHSGEECYTTVTECVHEHTDECYPEAGETEAGTGEGNATASDAEGREPENCTHSCSEESGCITKVLDCHHEHDESCGYKEAQECGYVCEICNGTESEDTKENTENTEAAGTDTAGCICETLCTEDSINGDCPVCGADDASLLDCKGKVPEENTENQEDTGICKHHQEHDDACGYQPASEDGEGSPCTYECRICPIEDLIAALPDKVTEDNEGEVQAQLEEILALYGELKEDEQGQIDLSRCYELQEALDNANAPMMVAGEININSTRINILTAETGDCPGHTFIGTTASYARIYVESGVHDVTFSNLNITLAEVGIAPGATMNLIIDGTNTIQTGNGLAGIYVPVGATLVINGTGSLNVSGNGDGAGIGGAVYVPDENGSDGDPNCGTVEINGGTVTATGGNTAAGIGGGIDTNGNPGNGGNVIINGGMVTATGGRDQMGYFGGAGIGGGSGNTAAGSGGTLTINGGTVNLTAGNSTSYGFGQGTGSAPDGTCELTLANASYLTADSLDPNGKYTIKSAPTADMISVPSDMHYTSADMAAEIKGKVTLAGKVAVCGRDFAVDTSGWTLDVAKVSDREYTATYTHAGKGTISKTVTILPCIHNNGTALTHHEGREADCTQTGVKEYWDCSICGKNFSDKDGKTEITDTEIPIAAHTLAHHDSVEATCTKPGVLEYWDCSVCKKKFSDKDGRREITDINIPVIAHKFTHYEGQEATCTGAGSREYWDCSACGKKFSDQNGQTEIADADIAIPLKPHAMTHHARQEGCLTDGSIEYWSCNVCGKRFADAGGTKEAANIKIPAAGHNYGGWKSNNDGTHTHSCQRSGCDSTETENCSGGSASYREKAKCEVCGGKYGELLKDAGAPTGEISISTNKWNSFLNTITFGLFFKKTEQVTIIAGDKESGVASVFYYISDSKLTEEEVKGLGSWTEGNTDKTTFSIGKDESCVAYAKITDNQGNVTYISSDGLVFDGTLPTITGVADGKTYCSPQTVTVTDDNLKWVAVNGEEKTLSDNKFTLSAGSGAQTIKAADKAGNITTVTVTVNAGHNYGTGWKSDKSSHWHACACGDKADTAAHTEDGGSVAKAPTEKEAGARIYKCSVCGYAMRTEEIAKLPSSAGGGGNDNTNPGNENATPQEPVAPSAETTANPGNETVWGEPGMGNLPVKPGNGITARPEITLGSSTGTPAEGKKQPFIKDKDGKIGWNVIRAEEEQAEEGSIINVDMNGATVVPGDIFDSIKGKDITIIFDMGNGILWSVDGKSITRGASRDKAGDIDFDLKTGTNAIPADIVNNVAGERYSIQLSLSHEGEFSFTAVLSLNLGKENEGYTASLYYYNEGTGELEFICADEVAEDGAVTLAFTHASDYIIVVDAGTEGEGGETESQLKDTDSAQQKEETDGNGGTAMESPKEGQSRKRNLTGWIVAGIIALAGIGAGVYAAVKKKEEKEE